MALFDMPLAQARDYRPDRDEPREFTAFWEATLKEARAYPLTPRFEPFSAGFTATEVYDVTFQGYGGQPVKAWLLLPRDGGSAKLPCLVEYVGYGGGRGHPFDHALWSSLGFAHLIMDTRGQGSSWRRGDTADAPEHGYAPHAPGFMTLGVESPHSYYYRRLYTDAVRAIETAASHPRIDPHKIAAMGGSQGGGLSLAAAALHGGTALVMPDVPFLCNIRRAVDITDSEPYQEIRRYCRIHRRDIEQVFQTLAYFDVMNFTPRITAPALFSVAMMDLICPPSTVFAAYNHYAGAKEICVYHYNDHEGGGSEHALAKAQYLQRQWGVPTGGLA